MRLRDGARDFVRNNPLAAKVVLEFETKAVGTGIRPQARTADPKANAVLDEAFEQWAEHANADGEPHYFGLQALSVRTIKESGEALLRHRRRLPGDGPEIAVGGRRVKFPYQVQLLEPDYLDHTKTQATDTGYIIQGVEFDKIGRRTGYWLHASHPGDVVNTGWFRRSQLESALVPADAVEHGRQYLRPGTVRSVSAFAPVIVALLQLDDYERAEQTRKLIEACLAAFVTGGDEDAGQTLTPAERKGSKIVEQFEPGMVTWLPNGSNVTIAEPKASGGYAEYVRTRQRIIAAGLGIPYEILTGDLSQVSYSSYRGGLIGYKNTIEALQWNVVVPFVCDPVWKRFVDTCVLVGLVPAGTPNLYGVEWGTPAFDLLDRLAEAEADERMIRIGTMTWDQGVQRQGYDPDKQQRQIADRNEKWDADGIVLDCDPRKTNRSGATQTDKTTPAAAA